MRDPFLCPDCQKLGYCRKYHTKPQERNFDKEEEAFFQRVNKPTVKVDQVLPATPVKLISLKKMRTHFRNQVDITAITTANSKDDIPLQINYKKGLDLEHQNSPIINKTEKQFGFQENHSFSKLEAGYKINRKRLVTAISS